MIDLRNIARQLRLPPDQLRQAAELLQQGYQPAFIATYRSDETGGIPEQALWPLKLGIERQQRLEAARHRAVALLGEGVELDEDAHAQLDQCSTEVEVESILRSFRARRAARQSGERSHDSSLLLERMIAYDGDAIPDVMAWVAAQLSVEPSQAEIALQHCHRLVGNLLVGDARLADRLRRAIQKKASAKVELINDSPATKPTEKTESAKAVAESTAAVVLGESPASSPSADATCSTKVDHSDSEKCAGTMDSTEHESEDGAAAHGDEPYIHHDDHECAADDGFDSEEPVDHALSEEHAREEHAREDSAQASPCEQSSEAPQAGKPNADKKKNERGAKSKKPLEKLTPRQRRRRWLISILQPFRSLNKPLAKLSAYQLLMLGRGQRSQLARLKLVYELNSLVSLARDVFVSERHPLASWFAKAAGDGLKRSLLAKLETDAVTELEELAQQRLLESATDQLRASLLQRPIRGHCILVIDTVGPKLAVVAIVDCDGNVLATDEISCASGQPSLVSQNVIRLGELVHRFKVTLVALSNGPARRFLIHTVAELMRQSSEGSLRWSMVDRGGAEAYAASRMASEELPQYNRRARAAIWMARRLQDPMREMLKVDAGRLRLGSFQRELPQESVQSLVHDTISDCIALNGVDTLCATEHELEHVPGVGRAQAAQIVNLVSQGKINSRSELLAHVEDWPTTASRQALGFLRVYGSPEALDGTAIHPEDYRLAQRVIQNTDLKAPPSAPEGWSKPARKVVATLADIASEALAKASASEQGDSAIFEQSNCTTSVVDASLDATIADSGTATSSDETNSQVDVAVSSGIPAAIENRVCQSLPDRSAPPDLQAGQSSATRRPGSVVSPEYPEDATSTEKKGSVIDIEKYARSWQVGRAALSRVANCLHDPFADLRLNRPWTPMQKEVPTFDSLKPGMSVWAVVVGVADFGAFVELGPDCSGLIHISRLSSNYIEDPHERVQIGDIVQTWVVSTDAQKKRVALTAISPEEQRELAQAEQRQRDAQRQQPQREQAPSQRRVDGDRAGANRGTRAPASASGGDRQPRSSSGRGAGQGGGKPRGRGDARQQQGSHSTGLAGKPVVVKSKKPKQPITDAMQKGKEPLRSFSDLMQYYELQRTEPIPPPTPAVPNEEVAPPLVEDPTGETAQ